MFEQCKSPCHEPLACKKSIPLVISVMRYQLVPWSYRLFPFADLANVSCPRSVFKSSIMKMLLFSRGENPWNLARLGCLWVVGSIAACAFSNPAILSHWVLFPGFKLASSSTLTGRLRPAYLMNNGVSTLSYLPELRNLIAIDDVICKIRRKAPLKK